MSLEHQVSIYHIFKTPSSSLPLTKFQILPLSPTFILSRPLNIHTLQVRNVQSRYTTPSTQTRPSHHRTDHRQVAWNGASTVSWTAPDPAVNRASVALTTSLLMNKAVSAVLDFVRSLTKTLQTQTTCILMMSVAWWILWKNLLFSIRNYHY